MLVLQFLAFSVVMAIGVVSFLRIQSEINVHLRGEEVRTSFGVYVIAVLVTTAVLVLLWFGITNVNWLSAIFYVVFRLITTIGVSAMIFLGVRRISRNPANNPDPIQLYRKWVWLVWLDALPILLLLWWSSSWCTWQGDVVFFFRLPLWLCTGLTIAMMIENKFRRLSWIRLAALAIVSLVIFGALFFTLRGGWVTQLGFMAVGPAMVPITFGYAWSRWVALHLSDESVYPDEIDLTGDEPASRHSTTRTHRPASSEGPNGTHVRVPIN